MKYIKSYNEFILESKAEPVLDLNEENALPDGEEKVILDFINHKEAELKKANENEIDPPMETNEDSNSEATEEPVI